MESTPGHLMGPANHLRQTKSSTTVQHIFFINLYYILNFFVDKHNISWHITIALKNWIGSKIIALALMC